MLTEEEIKEKKERLKEGLEYLRKFDELGAVRPDKREAATFTISAETLSELEKVENKSRFVEEAVKEKLEREAKA